MNLGKYSYHKYAYAYGFLIPEEWDILVALKLINDNFLFFASKNEAENQNR